VDAHLCVGQVYVRSFLSLMEYVIPTGELVRPVEGVAFESLTPFKVILDFNTVSAPGIQSGIANIRLWILSFNMKKPFKENSGSREGLTRNRYLGYSLKI
jgi:hypothetical protein